MKLTKYEQETIINFNKKEETAYIYTCSKVWMNHLEKKLHLTLNQINPYARTYECPKVWIRKPQKPRTLTEKQKSRLSLRLNLSSKTHCAVGKKGSNDVW